MTRSRRRKLKRAKALMTTVPLASSIFTYMPVVLAQQEAGALEEIVVTAQKRVESLQDVPLSITALGTEKLEDLRIQSFNDYIRFLPSVSYTSLGPGFGVAYFRGVASGENNNHSGPQPTVGMYLDEQPITTIQGALDLHLYDIARVESLAGPQGTLYGASSMAGTLRIITNKPDPAGFEAGYDLEVNTVKNGSEGFVAEAFTNIPLSPAAAIRLVGWYREETGYIDNAHGTRTFPTSGGCIENTASPVAGCTTSTVTSDNAYNDVETYGLRAALRIDLNESWTVTPSMMAQEQTADGPFWYDPKVGDLELHRYYPENSEDKWYQAALTVEGKISNFDVVYAGAYLDRDDVVNGDYSDYAYFYDQCCGYGAYWYDDLGVPLADPSQYIHGTDDYKSQSHEFRITSPQDNRLRGVLGLFYRRQEHDIFQRYLINGLTDFFSVTGWPDTIWLTNQKRIDRDYAVFGEITFDLMEQLSFTGGFRAYKSESSLKGFFGFNDNYSGNYGEALCFSAEPFNGSPCTNLDDDVKEDDVIPKLNLTYRFDDDRMVYATYSQGFRPAGINRNNRPPNPPHYASDTLTNYEFGWKTEWLDNRVRFNGAIFYEEWDDVQFSFLPPSGSGLTIIQNASAAEILGVEADVVWAVTDDLTLSGGLMWIDTELTENYCGTIGPSGDPETNCAVPQAPEGTTLPITPQFKSNLIGRYTFNVGEANAYLQGALVHQTSSWSDLITDDRAILGKQDGYTTADFSLGGTWNSFSMDVYLNNAFDERAEVFRFAQCFTGVCGGNPYYVTNQPRTFGVKFGQEF